MSVRNTIPCFSIAPSAQADIRLLWEKIWKEHGQETADSLIREIDQKFRQDAELCGFRWGNSKDKTLRAVYLYEPYRITIPFKHIVPKQPANTRWTKHPSARGIWLEPPKRARLPENFYMLRVLCLPNGTREDEISLDASLAELDPKHSDSLWTWTVNALAELHKAHGIGSKYTNPPPKTRHGCIGVLVFLVLIILLGSEGTWGHV